MKESTKNKIDGGLLGCFLFMAVTLLYVLIWGIPNMQHQAIVQMFGEDQAKHTEIERKAADSIHKLYTTRFYFLDEETQKQEAEKYFKEVLYPIIKDDDLSNLADYKRDILDSIYELNHSTEKRKQFYNRVAEVEHLIPPPPKSSWK
jgi:hypothetical protein